MASSKTVVVGLTLAAVAGAMYLWGHTDGTNGRELSGQAQAQHSPVEPAADRDVYYPNTEALAEDGPRPPPVSSSNLAMATNSSLTSAVDRPNAYRLCKFPTTISTRFLLGIYILTTLVRWVRCSSAVLSWGGKSHYESGVRVVRRRSLEVGIVDYRGYSMEVNEFDYKVENEIIFEENGVVVRSFPAIHSLDGPVSFSLEWNGLKFVFGSDTYPNNWFVQYAQDADLAVHECFVAVPDLVSKMRFTPEQALLVGTQIHTAPEAFGKVMSRIQPRMAIAYHFFKDFDTTGQVNDRIRSTYDGPLSLAEDFMVWNVTKDDIRVRMAVVEEATWAPPLSGAAQPPGGDPDRQVFSESSGVPVEALQYSDFIISGRWSEVDEALRGIYQEASDALGREFPYPEN
jgi:hypothetical protein